MGRRALEDSLEVVDREEVSTAGFDPLVLRRRSARDRDLTGTGALGGQVSAAEAHTAKILATFEALWREALAFVVEKWCHIQAVSDALLRKRTPSGEEGTEIIERIENRIQTDPPSVQDLLNDLRPSDAERLT